MAFMLLTVDIHMYLKAVYLLLFLVLLLIFYGLILVCFYTLGFKKRYTNGRDNPFEEDFDTVKHDDVDNERGSHIEECTESQPADYRPRPTPHKQSIYTMCKHFCNKRNYNENNLLEKVLLNRTLSSYLLSPAIHFKRVVLPVHRQERKPQNSTRKGIGDSASGCIDSKTKPRDSAEVHQICSHQLSNSTNGVGENPYHQPHGTKGKERNKEKGKEERQATSQSRNTDTGIIYDSENENMDDNTISRDLNALHMQTHSNNTGNIANGEKVSGNESDAKECSTVAGTNYTKEQVMSYDVDNEQERGILTSVNLQSSNNDGVHSCLPNDFATTTLALEQSHVQYLPNQGKAEPIEVHEDVIVARIGIRALKDYPTETLAVQVANGKILPLAPEEDFKEEDDTSGQKQLDVPSRKDQPHGPLAKLDVSGRIDQPQWPQQRLDVPSHKDQLPGPRPLMNDPVHLDQHPRLQTRFDDPGSKDRPPGPRVLIDDPGFKDRPRGTRPLIDDPCHKDQPPLPQQRLNNPSHKNRPPGPRLLIDDPDLKGRHPDPLPLMDDPGHKDQHPWQQTRLDTPSHRDQTPGPRPLMDDPGRNDKRPGQRPLMNDPVHLDQPPRLQTRFDDPGSKDRPPGPRVLMDDPGCKDRPRGTRPLIDDPCHKDQPPLPQQRLNNPSHKNRPPGPRLLIDDPDVKGRHPGPLPLMDDPGHKDQHPWQQTRFDDPGSKDRPPGPRVLMDDPGFKDRPRGTRPLIDDPCHKDQPPLPQQRLNNPSHKNQPPGPRLLIDDPDLKGRYPGPLPLMDDPGHKDQPPGPRLLINDPGLIDQPPWLLTRLDTPCHKDQTPGPRVLMDDPGRKDQPSGPRQLMNDPSCKNLPPRSQWHVTGPNNQHPGSLSHPHRFGCQDQSQDLVSWNRLPVRQDQTPASSLQNCVSNNHEGRRLQGPVHHRERNTLSPHEESLMVNDLLLEQPPSLQSHGDYHEPLDRMPLDGDLLNGIFPRLHEENQQVPVDNPYMEYGIVPDLITEPSPFINLNDYEKLDTAHLILHQDHQVLHQGRQQRPHNDERRQRHLNEDFDGSTQRDPVIRVGTLRDCRTVYASRVSHGLRDGTVDENYYLDGQMMCVVCRNRPVGVQLHPCGHIVYCRMCVRSQSSCRQCGGLVEDYTNA